MEFAQLVLSHPRSEQRENIKKVIAKKKMINKERKKRKEKRAKTKTKTRKKKKKQKKQRTDRHRSNEIHC